MERLEYKKVIGFTKVQQNAFKILINSIYGTTPIGSDIMWYKMLRIYTRKQKIKTIIND